MRNVVKPAPYYARTLKALALRVHDATGGTRLVLCLSKTMNYSPLPKEMLRRR
jgi:hypothetical protein